MSFLSPGQGIFPPQHPPTLKFFSLTTADEITSLIRSKLTLPLIPFLLVLFLLFILWAPLTLPSLLVLFQSTFKSAAVLILKKNDSDHNDLTNYRPISRFFFSTILKWSQVSDYIDLSIWTNHFSPALRGATVQKLPHKKPHQGDYTQDLISYIWW